ncbi:MAG: aconitate hydratase [Deltaproteobacteria bacterium]|nr:aconitate hydratase [Deltaproteobacteria bacterium]MBW2448312.1 aconitate hydratase [Deltaproteobacteria bacterium]
MSQTSLDTVRALYERLESTEGRFRKRLGRPLTYAEKILFLHLHDSETCDLERGQSSALFDLDRVAMQDVTAQMVMLQFMLTGRPRTAVPATIHCDHLIRARSGFADDLARAKDEHGEIYRLLEACAARYGLGFWKPGAGIIHQVVLEQYAFPGGMMIGADSHTPNAGGLGMIAIGAGGADLVEVMAGLPWGLRVPKLIGVKLTGEPRGWASGKDVILKLAGLLAAKGGTGAIIEYFGPGTRSLSTTNKSTITNMGAEVGATCSVFPYDAGMAEYLCATGREELAALTGEFGDRLRSDPEVEDEPTRFFDRVVEIDLDSLEPHIVGPHAPDRARPISKMAKDVAEHGFPDELASALIGSCTNSSYEDMGRAAHIAEQATSAGLKLATTLWVTPGSERIHKTIARDGQLDALQEAGATTLANACGPCIGQWERASGASDAPNSILTSYNRNFRRRNDGSANTLAFIASPEVVTALAFAGRLSFNPLVDSITLPGGGEFRFQPPSGDRLPGKGFEADLDGYVAPGSADERPEVHVAPDSERLQLLDSFPPWDGQDFERLPILLKAKGKTTTDQISPAGPWLHFRGHLERLSDNLFAGAMNAFTGEEGASHGEPFHAVARAHKAAGRRWVVFGDDNYGEGSSREHAAMSPRYLGCAVALAKSFARIHESNLKKQGILALTLSEPSDYGAVREDDRVSVPDLRGLAPRHPVTVRLEHADGSHEALRCTHSLTAREIEWFQAGSLLNWIREDG